MTFLGRCFTPNLGIFLVLIFVEVIYCGFWLSFSLMDLPYSWLFVINSFTKKKISKTNGGGIWRDLSCSFNTFPWKHVFWSVFFFWEGENLEKSPGISSPKRPKGCCFFFWGLRSIDPLVVEEILKKPETPFFFTEFGVLSFDFVLFLLFFANKKTQLTVTVIVGLGWWFEVVLGSAGIPNQQPKPPNDR